MKYSINSKHLGKMLGAISKVIAKRNNLPILGYVLLSYEDDQFYLTGSNGEHFLKMRINDLAVIDNSDFAPICLDINNLVSVAATLPEQPVEVEILPQIKKLILRYQGGKFEFPCVEASSYPTLPDMKDESVRFGLTSAVLQTNIRNAAPAIGADELRPVMSGVALDVNDEGVTFVATNGKILYKNVYTHGVPFLTSDAGGTLSAGRPNSKALMVIPSGVLSALTTVFTDAEMVQVIYDGQRTQLLSDGVQLTIRNIEGRYPNYNSVIPKDQPYHVVIDARLLANAVKRILLMASESSHLVVFGCNGMFFNLHGEDLDFSTFADEDVQTEDMNLPDKFKIGFNAHDFLSMLGGIHSDKVRIELADSARAALLKEDDPNSAQVELIMPMLIS